MSDQSGGPDVPRMDKIQLKLAKPVGRQLWVQVKKKKQKTVQTLRDS